QSEPLPDVFYDDPHAVRARSEDLQPTRRRGEVIGRFADGVLVRHGVAKALPQVTIERVTHLDDDVGVQVFLPAKAGKGNGLGSRGAVGQALSHVVGERDVDSIFARAAALPV